MKNTKVVAIVFVVGLLLLIGYATGQDKDTYAQELAAKEKGILAAKEKGIPVEQPTDQSGNAQLVGSPKETQWTSDGEESPTNAEVINSRVFMDDLKSHSDDYVIFAYNLPSPPKYIITEGGDQLAVEVECCQQHPSVAYVGLQLQNISSLNLQMTMDRRSKFVQTLSNIMKKINYTQEASIMNIK